MTIKPVSEEAKAAGQNTSFLEQRIQMNEVSQSLDLNSWVFSHIDNDRSELQILELCCGTGKQTMELSRKFPRATITAIDISPDAIRTIKNSSFFDPDRIYTDVVGIDEYFSEKITLRFDLIFCSYGLYYSQDIDQVLTGIYESLKVGGRLIVVGPYGDNNGPLFDDLRSVGVHIADQIVFDSQLFMKDKVLQSGHELYSNVEFDSAVNQVVWENKDQVIGYWKSSTFYDADCEPEFDSLLDQHFSQNANYVNEKHIGFIVLTK